MPKQVYQRGYDRIYEREGVEHISVTSVLDRLPKPGLQIWKDRRLIELYQQNADAYTGVSPKTVVNKLKAVDENTVSSGIGTIVHKYLETRQRPDDVDADVQPFLDRIDDFLLEYRPKVLFNEVTVYSPEWKYAGTVDTIFELGKRRYFSDLKTGKSVWPEVALQLSAYRHAHILDNNGQEIPIEEIGADPDVGIVLHVRPDKVEPREVKIGKGVFNTFLSILDIYYWEMTDSQTVLKGTVPLYE